jgi:hypothetical protein
MRVYQVFLFISTLLTGGLLLGVFITLSVFAMQDIYHEAVLQTAIDGIVEQGGYASSLVVFVFGILFTLQLKSLRASLSE